MFDDLDDDDVTDLIPDSEIEKKEKKLRQNQEQQGRRMTVSEVCKVGKHIFQNSSMKLHVTLILCM